MRVGMLLSTGACLAVLSAPALAFEAGQKWYCITDQGDPAFMTVHDFREGRVLYSWGRIDTVTDQLMTLCEVRDQLVLSEIKEFCRLLGPEGSPGHDRLSNACRAKAAQ